MNHTDFFVPPTATDPPVPAPVELTVPPTALDLPAPTEKMTVTVFKESFLLPLAVCDLPVPVSAVVPQATHAVQTMAVFR